MKKQTLEERYKEWWSHNVADGDEYPWEATALTAEHAFRAAVEMAAQTLLDFVEATEVEERVQHQDDCTTNSGIDNCDCATFHYHSALKEVKQKQLKVLKEMGAKIKE